MSVWFRDHADHHTSKWSTRSSPQPSSPAQPVSSVDDGPIDRRADDLDARRPLTGGARVAGVHVEPVLVGVAEVLAQFSTNGPPAVIVGAAVSVLSSMVAEAVAEA
jgi:hypothetical protein